MTAGIVIRTLAWACVATLVSSCTVSCKSKASGAKENAESLKNEVERLALKEVRRAVCPPDSKQKKGAKFDCQVFFKDGTKSMWRMEWVDNSLFNIYLHRAPKEVEDMIRKGLEPRAGKLKSVTCPKKIVSKPKSNYICTVVDAKDKKADIAVRFNEKGQPLFRIAKFDGKDVPEKAPDKKPPAKPEPTK